ncbi:phosphate ABC transporter substrate-binding protein PstS, partial [Streptomyces sp. NPDC003233]
TAAAGGTIALAQPVALAAGHGWTATQTLMLLAVILLLGLLLLPSLVSRLIGAHSGLGTADGRNREGSSR